MMDRTQPIMEILSKHDKLFTTNAANNHTNINIKEIMTIFLIWNIMKNMHMINYIWDNTGGLQPQYGIMNLIT